MIAIIPRTYRSLTPQRQTEFAILGSYTALCWLISLVGTIWLIFDVTGNVWYAALAPAFIEVLAFAGTILYVAGSGLALTWLRFLVAPMLLVSVAHLLGVTTPISAIWQYAVGAGLGFLFVYGQAYVDDVLRNAGNHRRASRQYDLEQARKRLEEEQQEDMARLQLTVAKLAHYQLAANTIRERLLDAVHPPAEVVATQPERYDDDDPRLPDEARAFGFAHSALQVDTKTCKAESPEYSCPTCGAALSLGQYGSAKRRGYCKACKKET